jgi:NAD(P)-dependent dehydrogenase (short-subunit alcohol dehydrogenase family)
MCSRASTDGRALASGTGADAIQSDAANRDTVIALVKALGPIDILVVNAGTLIIGDPLALDPGAVDRMIDLNVCAPYHASVEAARKMPDGGRIIVIGSTNGDRMPFAEGAAYAMTKSALQGIVRGLARDLGARGITVNIVQPGPTDTDMNPGTGPMSCGGLVTAAEEAVQTRRLRDTWADGIDPDAAVLEIENPGAGETAHRRLGRRIDAERRRSRDARGGCVEDDRAAVLEHGKRLLNREQDALDVGVEGAVEVLFGDGAKGRELPTTGIGEDHVDVGVLLPDRFVEAVNIVQARHVRLDGGYVRADRTRGGIERFLAAAGDEHRGSLSGEGGRRGEANAACAASHNHHLVCEPIRHRCSFLGLGWDP